MKYIIIYPGRFQPFALHHYKAYQHLCAVFGNVYIVTSNKVDQDSPLNFHERSMFIEKYVPKSNIFQCSNLYSPTELLNTIPEDTVAIFAYSSKDSGRLQYFKKNGEPGYFKPFTTLTDSVEFYKSRGYVYILPEFSVTVLGKKLSGTQIRSWIEKYKDKFDKNLFIKIFGYFDKKLLHLLINKIS